MDLEAITRRINDLRREQTCMQELAEDCSLNSQAAEYYFQGRRDSYSDAIYVLESLYREYVVTSMRVA